MRVRLGADRALWEWRYPVYGCRRVTSRDPRACKGEWRYPVLTGVALPRRYAWIGEPFYPVGARAPRVCGLTRAVVRAGTVPTLLVPSDRCVRFANNAPGL